MITVDEVKEALKTVVESKPPDWTNPVVQPSVDGLGHMTSTRTGCRYTDPDGNPNCIIGNLLDVLQLRRPAWGTQENALGIGAGTLAYFNVDAVELLRSVQQRADEGHPWSECIEGVV